MTMKQQQRAVSSQEAMAKEEGVDNSNNNHHKRVVKSSSPSTSFNDELQKSGDDAKRNDDGDESLTPSKSEHNNNSMDSSVIKQVPVITTDERPQLKHTSPRKAQDEELESTKAEMGEVMEENQRLKQYISQILKDYQTLQKKYSEISEQDSKQQLKIDNQMEILPPRDARDDSDDEEAKLVSLSLGRSSSLDYSKKGNINKLNINSTSNKGNNHFNDEVKERSLDLGLECKESSMSIDHTQTLIQRFSPGNSLDETKEAQGTSGEASLSNKLVKNSSGDDEVVQQPPTKKARVSVRVRCDTPTMNDGCQWRKYGQKIAKGNPCPRAYYRCTVAPSCPVRKQVQRCAEDMSILITTYEGTHNHPLPVSATAMAFTTSAAAYMLMSKSSTSSTSGSHPSTTIASTPIGTQTNTNILDNSTPNPIYTNSSTFSHNPTHPTITLDLTSSTSPSINQLNRVTPRFDSRYSSTNLTFNFSENSSNPLLLSWPNNGISSYMSQSYINSNQINPLNIGSSRQQQTPYTDHKNTFDFQQKSVSHNGSNHDSLMPDTIAQAAKVLTSDPSFQSILSATLSSFISGNNNNAN